MISSLAKKIFTRTLLGSMVFFLSQSASAQKSVPAKTDAAQEQLKKEIQKASANAAKKKQITFTFTQELYSFLRKKISHSHGRLELSRPHSFYWEILAPRHEIYVSNGKDFWKYIPSLKHAQHLKAQSKELSFINILTDFSSLYQHYEVAPWTDTEAKALKQPKTLPLVESEYPPAKQEKGKLYLKLHPLGDKQQKVLYAVLEVKRGLVDELRIIQLNGNRTRILFSYEHEEPVSPNRFNFIPPRGIAVDRQTLGD